MNRRFRVGFACLVFALPALASAFQVKVVPEKPRSMEPVYAHVTQDPFVGFVFRSARVSMSGNDIVVDVSALNDLGGLTFDVMLGRLPAGHYTVKVIGKLVPDGVSAQFDVVQPDMGDPLVGNFPTVNYSDLWWSPAQPGWGLSIAQGPTDELFAVWFVYDDAGRPTWYSLQPGGWSGADSYSGPLFKTSGPPPAPGTLAPVPLTVEKLGTARLDFSDASHGTLAWTIGGVPRSVPIERQVIE